MNNYFLKGKKPSEICMKVTNHKYISEYQAAYMHNFIPNLKIGKIDYYFLSLANHMHCSVNQVTEDKTQSPLQHLSDTRIIWTDQDLFLLWRFL